LPIDALGKQDVYVTILQNAINESSRNHDFFIALYYCTNLVLVSEVLLNWYGVRGIVSSPANGYALLGLI
jgi:hypothetical protein